MDLAFWLTGFCCLGLVGLNSCRHVQFVGGGGGQGGAMSEPPAGRPGGCETTFGLVRVAAVDVVAAVVAAGALAVAVAVA